MQEYSSSGPKRRKHSWLRQLTTQNEAIGQLRDITAQTGKKPESGILPPIVVESVLQSTNQ